MESVSCFSLVVKLLKTQCKFKNNFPGFLYQGKNHDLHEIWVIDWVMNYVIVEVIVRKMVMIKYTLFYDLRITIVH